MDKVSFGKYRGQSWTVLLNDAPYLNWCRQQAWFKEKYSKYCMTGTIPPQPPRDDSEKDDKSDDDGGDDDDDGDEKKVEVITGGEDVDKQIVIPGLKGKIVTTLSLTIDESQRRCRLLERSNVRLMEKIEKNKMEIHRLRQPASIITKNGQIGQCLL